MPGPTISVDTSLLSKMLAHVKPAVSRSGTAPACEAALLIFEPGGAVSVAASNGVFFARATADTGIDGPERDRVEYLIPAHSLAAVLAACGPDAEIRTESSGSRVEVRSGRYRTRIPLLPVDVFLSPGPMGGATTVGVGGDVLAGAIGAVSYAVSTDLARANLCGVHLDAGRAVATDGRRIAVSPPDDSLRPLDGLTLPGYALAAIAKAVSWCVGDVSVDHDDGRIAVGITDVDGIEVRLRAQLVQGQYPAWPSVVPEPDETTSWRARRSDLLTALGQVSALRSEAADPVRIEAADEPGLILLTVLDPERGEATAVVEYDGHAPREPIAANLEYLREALRTYSATTVSIQTSGPASPIRIDGADTDPLCVVMPMRI